MKPINDEYKIVEILVRFTHEIPGSYSPMTISIPVNGLPSGDALHAVIHGNIQHKIAEAIGTRGRSKP